MINRIKSLPEFNTPSAEAIKAENLFNAYGDDAQLFLQNDTGAIILLLDGDMIISGKINAKEAKPFLSFLKPRSIFSNAENLTALDMEGGFEEVNVIINENCPHSTLGTFSYEPSSREIYDILCIDEFELPPYEYFATDYCRRKNHGLIKVFAKQNTCAAITLEGKNYRMLGGIATRQKGLGGSLLLAAASGEKQMLAVCRDDVLPFYTKYGFKPIYKAGYWRKNT